MKSAGKGVKEIRVRVVGPQESLNLELRSQLMDTLIQRIAEDWNQTEAAKRLDVIQPCISDLFRGKISQFSLDMLVNMLAALGDDVQLAIKKVA